jgi:uncharacterized LabA/DUF88 family protein
LVKFFGKTRTTRKEAAPKAGADAAPKNGAKSEIGAAASKAAPPGPPATKAAAAAASAVEPEKKPATRRRTSARPPRRDWAAEAAAAPIGAPAPAPSSLATAPSPAAEADAAQAPAKRRRGTRGGRGRHKPGTALTVAEAAPAAAAIAVREAEPMTIERAMAQQAAVLESFAHDVSSTLKKLQATMADMQARADRAPATTSYPRVGIFVDVPNLIYASERRNINLDFGRVLDYFTRGRELVRASAYAPISDDPQAKLESQRFVHHFVGHPYRIVTKPLKRFADGSMKANFDIELAIDILTMSDRLDVVVLMSGDGDFRRLVELVASRGVRVEIVAFAEAASAELKTAADLYVDIGAHLDDFKALK